MVYLPIAFKCVANTTFDKNARWQNYRPPWMYTGGISKQPKDCEKHPVRDFNAIETEMLRLSDETKDQLSCDQKYQLYFQATSKLISWKTARSC